MYTGVVCCEKNSTPAIHQSANFWQDLNFPSTKSN